MDFLHLFKKHWQCAVPEQWRILFYLFWHSLSVIGSLWKPYAFAMALNHLQTRNMQMAGQWLGFYIAGFVLFETGHRIARSTERYLAFRNRKRFLLHAYDRLQDFPLAWHTEHHSANLIDRLNKAANALFEFGQSQSNYIEVMVNLLGSLVFLWILSPIVALVGCMTGIVSVLITKYLYKKSVPEYRKQNELFHTLAAALMDYISNMTTIITLRLGKRARTDLEKRNDAVFPHLVKEHRITQVKCFISALLELALNVGMVIFYIFSQNAAGGFILVGSVAAVFQYLNLLINAFGFYSGEYENCIHWWQDYNAAAIILDESAEHAAPRLHSKPIPQDWQVIETSPFSFSYGKGLASLQCSPIRFERGKRIAFIGESGAGKSTCLHILGGLLSAEGTFTVDGQDSFSLEHLAKLATLICQQPEIFENTVRYNITLGFPTESGELETATQIACFDEVTTQLSKGYDTDIREDGFNLSGGEKQRLALARGIFAMQDSSLLLLDEPTGNLDVSTEAAVYQKLFAAFPNSCIVSTIHRLHLLPSFDMIYVFNKGRMVESGSFTELLTSEGVLAELWKGLNVEQV